MKFNKTVVLITLCALQSISADAKSPKPFLAPVPTTLPPTTITTTQPPTTTAAPTCLSNQYCNNQCIINPAHEQCCSDGKTLYLTANGPTTCPGYQVPTTQTPTTVRQTQAAVTQPPQTQAATEAVQTQATVPATDTGTTALATDAATHSATEAVTTSGSTSTGTATTTVTQPPNAIKVLYGSSANTNTVMTIGIMTLCYTALQLVL